MVMESVRDEQTIEVKDGKLHLIINQEDKYDAINIYSQLDAKKRLISAVKDQEAAFEDTKKEAIRKINEQLTQFLDAKRQQAKEAQEFIDMWTPKLEELKQKFPDAHKQMMIEWDKLQSMNNKLKTQELKK